MELPDEVVADAERLTRLARRTTVKDEAAAYRADRDNRLADFRYEARVREEERRSVLVLYPTEWLEEGTVQLDRIEDRSRAVEIPLGGVGEENDWEAVEAHNAKLVAQIAEDAGPVHATNARAFADFMGNHYVRRMDTAGEREVREFLDEYFPRNAWPTGAQCEVIEESLELVFDTVDAEAPRSLD